MIGNFKSFGVAAIVAATAFTASAAVPPARLIQPIDGLERPSQLIVMWGTDLETELTPGSLECSITTPSGRKDTYTGFVQFEDPADQTVLDYNNAYKVKNLNFDEDSWTVGYTESGRYTVSIPKGMVYVNGEECPAATLYFTAKGTEAPELGYADADPAGPFVGALGSLELNWKQRIAANVDEADMAVEVSVDGTSVGKAPVTLIDVNGGGRAAGETVYGDRLLVELGSLTDGVLGEVTFTLPEGMVRNTSGSLNPEQDFVYDILKVASGEKWSPDPFDADGNFTTVYKTQTVSVSWDADVAVNPYSENAICCRNADDIPVVYFYEDGNMFIDGNTVTFSLSGVNHNGVYTIEIPDGAILVGKDALNSMTGGTYRVIASAPVEGDVTANPVPGTYADLSGVTLSWGGKVIEPGDEWDEDAVKVTVTGATLGSAPQVSIVDANGDTVYPASDWSSTEPGVGLFVGNLWIDPMVDSQGNPLPYEITIAVPRAMVAIEGDAANAPVSLDYDIVPLSIDFKTLPAKGSMLPSLEEIEVMWAGTEGYVLGINPDCTSEVTYGPLFGEQNPVGSVSAEKGTVVIRLPQKYTGAGWLSVTVPDGYLMAVKGDESVVVSGDSFSFNIQEYYVVPNANASLNEPFQSFTIASCTGDIALVGKVADIEMFDAGSASKTPYATGRSSTPAELDGMSALTIAFNRAFDTPNGMVRVNIPAGTFSFGGNAQAEPISLEYYIHPPLPLPTVTPASGSKLRELDVIEVSWHDSPLVNNPGYFYDPDSPTSSEPFTVSHDGVTDVVNDCVRIVNVFGSSDIEGGPAIESSTLVIDFGKNPYVVKGDYVVTIPAGYARATLYNDLTGEVVLVYALDGTSLVEMTAADADGLYRVYGLDGVNVLTTSDASALSGLPAGIYVINGRKVIVRR